MKREPTKKGKIGYVFLWERPLMMSDFRGEGGLKGPPKIRTLEGKNRMSEAVKNDQKIEHHLWMFP